MSGGSDTTTQTSSVPGFVQPYAENYLQKSQQVADMPYQAYDGQTVAQMNPFQSSGLNAQAQRAIQGSPVVDAASSEAQRTLNGGYLGAQATQGNLGTNPYSGSNPYLQKMIDASAGDVVRNYNNVTNTAVDAAAARAGSFGNSGIDQARLANESDLQKNLGNLSNQYRFQDYTTQQGLAENAANRQFQSGENFANRQDALYSNERNRQVGAIGQAPGLANQDYVDANALQSAGAGFQGQEQANLTDQYNRFQQAQIYPQQQLATLGKGLGLNFGTTSTMQTPGANPWAQGLGAAAAGYGAYTGAKSGGGK